MEDPVPENITGQKVRRHKFEHSIRWDYVLITLAVMYVAWKLFGAVSSSSEDDDDLPDDLDELGAAVQVPVGGGGLI